jgi:hypothetical protein
VLQQAQRAASSAAGAASAVVSSVTDSIGGVSLGSGKPAGAEVEKVEKLQDDMVDKAKDEKVEDFIKAQYPSTTAKAE